MTERALEDAEPAPLSAAGAPPREGPARSLAILVALAALRLWLAADFPFSIEYLLVDDYLYIEQTDSLARGAWLGDYDARTLTKEIGLPLFLAGANLVGVPARVAMELLWILACWTLFLALRRCGLARWAAGLITAATLFHPAATCASFSRVVRENVYGSQILLIAALGLVLVTAATRRARCGWTAALALVSVWTWHTREEGVWLIPILATIALGLVALNRRAGRWRESLAFAVLLGLLVAGGLFGYRALVTGLNARHYGEPILLESKEHNFRAAAGALIRAEPEDERRYHPVRPATFAMLYEVSPTFAQLKPIFESGAFRDGWKAYPDGSRASNGVQWTLRTGASDLGHHENPTRAKAFYGRIADEINAHLDQDPELYGPRRVSVFPPIRLARWWPELIDEIALAIQDMWRMEFRQLDELPDRPHVGVPFALERVARRALGQDALPERPAQAGSRNVLLALLGVYRAALPWLALLGLAALVVHVFVVKRLTPALFFVLLLGVIVLLRCGIVAALEIWAIPSRSTYLLCALPIFSAGALLAVASTAQALIAPRLRGRGLPRPAPALWWPAAALLVLCVFQGARAVADGGPRFETPMQLAARVSPDEPLSIVGHRLRLTPREDGLDYRPTGPETALIVKPWSTTRRPVPVDLRLKGRALGSYHPAMTLVVYGQADGLTDGEIRIQVPLYEDGSFDHVARLNMTQVRLLWLGLNLKDDGRLHLDTLAFEPRDA